jgi:hypothetical protein
MEMLSNALLLGITGVLDLSSGALSGRMHPKLSIHTGGEVIT